MSKETLTTTLKEDKLRADCERCFGLCCVALPYAKSADFAFNKEGGTPCQNLNSEYRCDIHENLRKKGFPGCTVYECFGAGQKVSQYTFNGRSWREYPETASEMFQVFPIMQQLHEMLCYLQEALDREETKGIKKELLDMFERTEKLTYSTANSLLELDVPSHRAIVNELLLRTSALVRGADPSKSKKGKGEHKGKSYFGAKLKGADFRSSDLRGAFFIAADLRNADLRNADLIGTDLRDADLSGADLTGSIFVTQAQVNSAKGDIKTKLPSTLSTPRHWIN
jgi:uncharacterized protein YjbI with pentapeptide repeats